MLNYCALYTLASFIIVNEIKIVIIHIFGILKILQARDIILLWSQFILKLPLYNSMYFPEFTLLCQLKAK